MQWKEHKLMTYKNLLSRYMESVDYINPPDALHETMPSMGDIFLFEEL